MSFVSRAILCNDKMTNKARYRMLVCHNRKISKQVGWATHDIRGVGCQHLSIKQMHHLNVCQELIVHSQLHDHTPLYWLRMHRWNGIRCPWSQRLGHKLGIWLYNYLRDIYWFYKFWEFDTERSFTCYFAPQILNETTLKLCIQNAFMSLGICAAQGFNQKINIYPTFWLALPISHI